MDKEILLYRIFDMDQEGFANQIFDMDQESFADQIFNMWRSEASRMSKHFCIHDGFMRSRHGSCTIHGHRERCDNEARDEHTRQARPTET